MKLKGKHPGMFLLASALAVSGGIGLEHAKGHREFKRHGVPEPDPTYDLVKLEKAREKRERKKSRK
jgi:hypothetical protein